MRNIIKKIIMIYKISKYMDIEELLEHYDHIGSPYKIPIIIIAIIGLILFLLSLFFMSENSINILKGSGLVTLIFDNFYTILTIYFAVIAIILTIKPPLGSNRNILINMFGSIYNIILIVYIIIALIFQIISCLDNNYGCVLSNMLIYDIIFIIFFIVFIIYSTSNKILIRKCIKNLSRTLPQKHITLMDVSKEKYNYQNGAFSTDICSKIEAEEKDICELEFKTLLGYYNVNFNSIEKLLHEYNIQLAHLYIQKNNINLKYITSETLNEEKKEKFIFEIKELIMDKTNEITVLKQPYQAELHNYQSLLHGITKKNDLEILCEYIVEIVEKVDNPDKDYNILIDEFKEYMVRLGDNNECQDYFLNGLNYHIIPYNYRNIEKIMELRYKVLISIIKNKTNTPGYYELLGYTSIIVYLGTVYNHLIEDKEECKYIKYLIDQILEQYIKYLDELIKLNNLNDRYKQNLVLDEILYFKEGKYNFIEDTTYNEFHTKYELDIKSNNIINTLFYLILKNIYLNYIDKSWINTIVILCKEYGTDDKNRDNISQEYELMYKYRPILFYILYWQENKELKEILDYSEFNEKKEDNLFLKDLTELTYRDIEVYGTHRLHFEKFKRDALKITEEYYKNNEMK